MVYIIICVVVILLTASLFFTEEQHKRITLLPETVTLEDRLFIKSIYEARCLMEEISWDEANDILVRAAPRDV